MTPQQIAADIERGNEIRKDIARLAAELKAIEGRLTLAAEDGEHVPLQEAEREGRQCLLRSPRLVLPVRFTADSIVGTFAEGSPVHKAIKEATGEKFSLFFKPQKGFARVQKDGLKFRKEARANLEPDNFAKLIQAATVVDKTGVAKSTVQIAWDDAKAPEAVPQ